MNTQLIIDRGVEILGKERYNIEVDRANRYVKLIDELREEMIRSYCCIGTGCKRIGDSYLKTLEEKLKNEMAEFNLYTIEEFIRYMNSRDYPEEFIRVIDLFHEFHLICQIKRLAPRLE